MNYMLAGTQKMKTTTLPFGVSWKSHRGSNFVTGHVTSQESIYGLLSSGFANIKQTFKTS